MRSVRVCFIGGAEYDQPLDPTSEKKFRALVSLAEIFVVSYGKRRRFHRFTQCAHFVLLPRLPGMVLRQALLWAVWGPVALSWALRRGEVVLIAQSPYEGALAATVKGAAAVLGRRVVLIVESHGDFEETLFIERQVPLAGLVRAIMRVQAGFALRAADLLRAVSTSTRDQLARWAPGRRIVVFPAWTDIDVFLEAGKAESDRAAGEILYAGIISPRKGLHHLVRGFAAAAAVVPAARLVLVGRPVNPGYAAFLRRTSEALGVGDRIAFLPEEPQARLAQRMGRAAALVLPSVSEGLGRVLVEAMAAGTPVIGSRVGGIVDLVEDGVTGLLCPPGDAEALGRSILWILEHAEEARDMGRRARTFATEYFSLQRYVDGYARLFEAAAAMAVGPGRRRPS